jgi:protein-tyrosine phosphatase
MDTLINFRDFGRLTTTTGGQVRAGCLFRSGQLAGLSRSAVEYVTGLDFALIADLRYPSERDERPSPWPATFADRIYAHSSERKTVAPHLEWFAQAREDPSTIRSSYLAYYRALPFEPHYRRLFGRVLNALVDGPKRLLVHCTAGKDRTGVLVALIQHALGIPREAVMNDYMGSNGTPGLARLAKPVAADFVHDMGEEAALKIATQLFRVEKEYLEATFEAIEQRCGTVDAYLSDAGLNKSRRLMLRARYVDH